MAFVIERERNGDPEGVVLAHAKHRQTLHRRLAKADAPHVYLTFAGPPIKPGYIAVFWLR